MAEKIFFVTNAITHYTVKLYELLSQKIDVEYYFTGGEETYTDKKNELRAGHFKGEYLSGAFLLPKFRFTPKLLSVLFKKYDVMVKTLDDRFALPLCFAVAKMRRKPFILWTGLWHHPETFAHKISRFFTKTIYLYSDAIVVYGKHIKQYLISLGVSEDKIFIAAHAVDNEAFNKEVSAEEKKKLKSKMGVGQGKVILYVGRLEKCKGIEYFIEAMKGIKNDFHVLFIGRGNMRNEFEEKCKEYKLHYRFLDYVPNENLYLYYGISDIFVLPSVTTEDFKEPWGLVINEAMNQGCPVIVTDAVGAAAGGLVVNGKNGFVISERSVAALKEAIEKILKDEQLRRSMGQASRETIVSWTPERMAQGFLDAIQFVSTEKE